ncbi:MAG: glycosyltransferase [Patescibacteria group bacterium]
MRVALIHDFLTQYGGAEKVLEVFHEIWPEAPVFTLLYDKDTMGKHFKDYDIKVSPIQNLPFGVKKYRWYLPLMQAAIERFNLNNFDLVISNTSAYSKGVITKPHTRFICYCLTPTRYLWSDTYEYLDGLTGAERLVKKFLPPMLTDLRKWDFIAAQRPDFMIAISKFVAQRIKKYYRRQPETIIYPPVDTDKFHISNEIGDYFLMVSRFRPYKKVDLVIQTFNKLKIPLKLIGIGEDKAMRKIAGPNIEFLGFVSEKEKAHYLSHCKAFIHPQEEDFGITVVEAMASGRPVIAYKAGGALETVIEGETGEFFDEQNWENLAETIIKFKPENYNPEKIRSHALKFNKERFKKEFLEFINSHV